MKNETTWFLSFHHSGRPVFNRLYTYRDRVYSYKKAAGYQYVADNCDYVGEIKDAS